MYQGFARDSDRAIFDAVTLLSRTKGHPPYSRLGSLALTVILATMLAACGGGGTGGNEGSLSLSDRVIERFKQAGVSLHEVTGLYAGGDDTQLAPDSRAKFGDFVVHVVKNASGFSSAEAGAGQAGADAIRWDDALANHRPPYFTSFKRYGSSLELQWSSGSRSTNQPQWHQLDAIIRQIAP